MENNDLNPFYGSYGRVTERLVRISLPNRKRQWKKLTDIEPKLCQIIGKRKISNGRTDWDGDYSWYEPEEYLDVYLVSEVHNMKSNPFYVTKEHVFNNFNLI